MSSEKIDRYYCDNCGDPVWQSASRDHPEIKLKDWRSFNRAPFSTDSTCEGESCVVCEECYNDLKDDKASLAD